ncbi:MAG: magnesium transporter [Defluviitaleaceae bacterium]|nr:magnesium transporter [Defluviitaleaceae bacterium]
MDKIKELLAQKPLDENAIKDYFANMNEADIADILEQASDEEAIAAFRLLDEELAADVFSYITPDKQQMLVERLNDAEVKGIMSELAIDDMVDFIDDVPDDVGKYVLDHVSQERGALVDHLLNYPEDSAGSVMTTEIVELSPEMTVKDALQTIRTSGVDKETIYTCYVIDQDRKLIGAVTADTLVRAGLNQQIDSIMDTNVISANAADDQEELTNQFRKYDLIAMPVVSRGGQLVGIVTVDDILRVITEETTEDVEKMAGIINLTDEPYMRTGVLRHAGNRIAWLLILMLTAAITGAIISTFEDSLAVLPVLVAFIPMLMGAGGNAGAQSTTVVIRGMALGEIVIKDVLRVVWRETRIALVCGVVLGIANYARIWFMHDRNATLALVVSLSLGITLVVAKSIGCTLPILAKKMKIDPATMAAPIITTIVDCTALIVFFSIARIAFNI